MLMPCWSSATTTAAIPTPAGCGFSLLYVFMSPIPVVSAKVSAPKCKFTPALSQSEFFCSAAPLPFPKDTVGEDDRTADTVQTKQPVPLFFARLLKVSVYDKMAADMKSVSPDGIYRTKDTRRSKQSVEGKGQVSRGLLWSKWDAVSLKNVHSFWQRLRSGGLQMLNINPVMKYLK